MDQPRRCTTRSLCHRLSGIEQDEDASGRMLFGGSFGTMEAHAIAVERIEDVPDEASEPRAGGEEHHVVARPAPAKGRERSPARGKREDGSGGRR
jgi:hypothetical protein